MINRVVKHMSEKRYTDRIVIDKPPPKNRVLADRLSRPATVVHPTLAGDDAEFEVVIERVYYRPDDDDTESLCFRGKATAGSWSGYKTFFAENCRSVTDRADGSAVGDLVKWLTSLHDDPDPLTLESLMKAVSDYLDNELAIKIGRMGARTSPDGVTISYTDITDTDPEEGGEPPYEELQFFIDLLVVESYSDPITTDPMIVTVSELVTPETTSYEIDGITVTETTRQIPMGLALEVIPCAGGRVDVRSIARERGLS
jgi:hypothetical protein